MKLRTLSETGDITGKHVLLRVDFNVPLKGKKVIDDFKLRQTLPTIEYLLKKKAHIIMVSHLGRPKQREAQLSLRPVANHFAKLLQQNIFFTTLDLVMATRARSAKIVFLENIRFYKEEEKNTPAFAQRLAKVADIFVLDGFGASHRAGASIVGVSKLLPSYAGLLFETEIGGLARVMQKPKKPLVVVLGGAKMETKIPVLKKLLSIADHILIGGGMANTYYASKGYRVGKSLVDKKYIAEMATLSKNKKIIFPIDAVYGTAEGKHVGVTPVGPQFKLPKAGLGIYDVGPATIQLFTKYLKKAETIVWNGALGYFEQKPYQYGTYMIAEVLAQRAKGKAFGVAGGGETVEVIKKLGLLDSIDLVSTGGGAMLEYLSGAQLPGVVAVSKK